MPFRPEEEEPKLTIKLTNTERVTDLTEAQAGEGNAINDAVAVRFESDDFTSEIKTKIGQYLETELREEANQSQARIENRPPRPEVLVGHDPNATSEAGPDSYIANQPQTIKTAFNTTGISGQFKFDVSVKRGESTADSNEDPEANVLRTRLGMYSNVNEQNNNSILSKAVENLIDRNARFSPKEDATPYIVSNNPAEESAGTRSHVFYKSLGSHPGDDFTLPSDSAAENQAEVTIEQLRDLGLRLLLQASGETFIPENTSTEQITLARGVANLTPGLGRLGVRQNFSRFTATELLNKVNPDAQKAKVDIDLAGSGNASYGNVNNPLVPFAAISSSTSSIIVGSLLIMTVSAIIQGLAETFSVGSSNLSNPIGGTTDPSLDEGVDINANRRRRLGSFLPVADQQGSPGAQITGAFNNLTGYQNLLFDTKPFRYNDCIARGLQIFFGIQTSGTAGQIVGGTITGAASSVITAPGYWNTILRSIIKGITDPILSISNGIANLGGTKIDASALQRTAYDIDQLIGPDGDPEALLGIITLIKESRILKVMNIIASIGRIDLSTNANASNNNVNISKIDSIADTTTVSIGTDGDVGVGPSRINPAALVKKNRLSDRVKEAGGIPGALAWGTSTLPSLYLQSTNLIVAEELFTGETVGTTAIKQQLRKDMAAPTTNGRLDPALVRQIEDELESYYVPFYFHDLRTNEIIALHSFIESMSDSFNAEYAETAGYGRIGNVYTYKNTTRSISISFKIIATNKDDFDQMWYKINKILMFCFPQYTSGRPVSFENTTGTYNFVQPFSQLPSSSPIIRLRIGDVFKTNYSDFDLARLHGLGERFKTPSISSESGTNLNEDARRRLEDKVRDIVSRYKKFEFQEGDKLILNRDIEAPTNLFVPETEFNGIRISIAGSSETIAAAGIPTSNAGDVSTVAGVVETPTTDARRNMNVALSSGETLTIAGRIAPKIYRVTRQDASGDMTNIVMDFSGLTDASLISPDKEYVYSQAKLQTNITAADLANVTEQIKTEVANFFDPNAGGDEANANPIFKAFNSVKGEGIPGVVKSINFDWNNAIWETEALNSKAPRWVTVQMEFAPIFEINPGLDANGEMIGAIYNVGSIMQKLKQSRERGNEQGKRIRYVKRQLDAKTRFEDS